MKTNSLSNRTLVCALVALAAFAIAAPARASVIVNDPNLPVPYPVAQYVTLGDLFASFHGPGLTVVFSDTPLRNFGMVTRSGGVNEVESFSSQFDGLISVNGSPNAATISGGPQQDLVFGKVGNTTGTFNTEILSLNISGSSPFGPFMIRESPTLASTGQTTITSIGGGMFQIDSFFDVFTELSLDGGNSWIPSDTSTHLVLVPEPCTITLLLLSSGMLALRRRRY